MASKTDVDNFFSTNVLGHPAGLFVLFFTEMWERFSYYGMRALLVLFLVSAFGLGGWDWPRVDALALYGTYTALVYLTPILGGYIADKFIGYRKAVVIGAVLMTLGHVSLAMEFAHIFLYIGIGFLIIGNGFFKPNITSIISKLYERYPEKKDGAYTIFYMGVNAGAFLGILLCGYLGEKVGWSYGFGLAGVFMFLGMLQFYFAQNIFGEVGKKPLAATTEDSEEKVLEFEGDRLNHFTLFDKILIGIVTLIGLVWIINDPVSKIGGFNLLAIDGTDYSNYFILAGLVLFLGLLISRILRYPAILRDRMIAIVLFAIFTVCFWASFEQAGGSMTIFAKDYTDRIMSGDWSTVFVVINILITIIPIGIISWVLAMLFRQTYKKYLLSNVILGFSFLLIWCIAIWMIQRNLNSSAFVMSYNSIQTTALDEEGNPKLDKNNETIFEYQAITESMVVPENAKVVPQTVTIIEPVDLKVGDKVSILDVDKHGKYILLDEEKVTSLRESFKANEKSTIVSASIVKIKENQIEVPATWFLILNSLFIIVFAPMFSKWWESKYNPSGAVKYGLGLILLGIGFSALAFGSLGIDQGAKVASVSMVWLILAFLFHTLGELCLSPVSLSYISKLVPGRMIAMMFGVWYIAIAIGNKIAGSMGGQIDAITEQYSMTTFFLIFTLVPVGLGVIAILLNPLMKKLMHGIR